jgi:ribosome biogenesis GTPase
VQANFYRVCLDETKEQLLCTRPTRLKKIGQKVMVGDRVMIKSVDNGRGAIAQVLSRQTELERPPVANASQILLVFALEQPSLEPIQLTRFLVKAESVGLPITLALNKTDLITNTQRQQWQKRLQEWGYSPVFISVEHNQGIDRLIEHLRGHISIFAGPSGVGKSSLINYLIPDAQVRVSQVSGKLNKGRHTTRHVELFELVEGSLLADTPGFNQPDIDCEPAQLCRHFPEIRARFEHKSCQFSDCLHRDEPNCVVRGEWERYEYYLILLEEVIARQELLHQRKDEESSLKLRIKGSGISQYEPRLESKKYRRTSRREKHQNLQEFYDDEEKMEE